MHILFLAMKRNVLWVNLNPFRKEMKKVTYAIAVGEANAAMGRIVAAPTAGASGIQKHHSC